MVKLLIIADDFTGALDTGVQLAKRGIKTKVKVHTASAAKDILDDVEVLVINTETRPLSADKAYEVVYKIASEALKNGVKHIYKKTDSALRGNVASELKAVADAGKAYGFTLAFVPAYPEIGRTTIDGKHYINGMPLCESVFGDDPFEPVLTSDIKEILNGYNVSASLVDKKMLTDGSYKEIYNDTGCMSDIVLFDAVDSESMEMISDCLVEVGETNLMAGCAGFAAYLPKIINLNIGFISKVDNDDGLVVFCGSLNPITEKQVEYAVKYGFTRITLNNEQKLGDDYFDQPDGSVVADSILDEIKNGKSVIVDTFDVCGEISSVDYARHLRLTKAEARRRIANNLGRLAQNLVDSGLDITMVMTGGDTLMGFIRIIGIDEIIPIAELGQGAVVSTFDWDGRKVQIISKSGGFGDDDIFVHMEKEVKQ